MRLFQTYSDAQYYNVMVRLTSICKHLGTRKDSSRMRTARVCVSRGGLGYPWCHIPSWEYTLPLLPPQILYPLDTLSPPLDTLIRLDTLHLPKGHGSRKEHGTRDKYDETYNKGIYKSIFIEKVSRVFGGK